MESEVVSKKFVVTPEIRRALGVTEDVLAWSTYWQPLGDEAECYRLHRGGALEGGTSDWLAYQSLERLNAAEMRPYNFGSSESDPEYVVFVDELRQQTSFVPYKQRQAKFDRIRASLPI